jgi:WD40 repeat protein
MNRGALLISWFWVLIVSGLAAGGDSDSNSTRSQPPQLWAIIVGVGKYSDPTILQSQTAPQQAAAVLQWFRAAGWDEDHQLLLRDFGSNDPGTVESPAPSILPTRKNLVWAFDEWLNKKAKPGDMVVVYFSGRAGIVTTGLGPRVEPRVDHYLLATDSLPGSVAATGWSLDRALDDCARRRVRAVCWLATTVRGAPGAAAIAAKPPANRPPLPTATGHDWLQRLTRWPGVTAWLAADRPLGVGQAADPAAPFTAALLKALGTPDHKKNLAACLRELQELAPELRLQGFQTSGGVPPRLSLWADEFGRQVKPLEPEMVLQVGHGDKITSIASPADHRLLISASLDSTVRVLSLEDHSLLKVWTGHTVGATALGLSRDDRWLVSGGGRGAVLVHDLRDFSTQAPPRLPHNKPVVQIAMLPDGDHFVSLDSDGRAVLWDLNLSPLDPKPWPDKTQTIREVACGDDARGGTVAARCGDGSIQLFDAKGAGGTVVALAQSHPTSLAVAPDGLTLAAGFADGRVVLYEIKTRRQEKHQVGSGPILQLVFSGAGRLAVGHEKGVRLISLSKVQAKGPGSKDQAAEGFTALAHVTNLIDQPAGSVAISPGGRFLAVATENLGAVRVWQIDGATPARLAFDDAKARASAVGFTLDGQTLLIGEFDGSIALRPLETIEQRGRKVTGWTIPANRAKIQHLDCSRDRRLLLILNELNQAQICNLKDRTCRRMPGYWTSGVFVGEGELVLTIPADAPRHAGYVIRARPDRDWTHFEFNPNFFVRSAGRFQVPEHLSFDELTLAADGSRIAATAGAGQVPLVCVWEPKTGRLTHWIPSRLLDDEVRSLRFSVDGRYLLTAGNSPDASLWDLAASQGELAAPVARFRDPDGRNVTCAAIRPTSTIQVVTGHSDGHVNLWSWREGQTAKLESAHLVEGIFAGKVRALTFTSDGRKLAAAGDGTTIWLGEMEPAPGPVEDLDALRPHHFEQINALLAWGDQPFLVSGSDDTTIRFWDLKSKKLWGTFCPAVGGPEPGAPNDPAPVRELDWVLYTPEGFFDSTSNGSKLVRFRLGDKAENMDQFEKTRFTFRLGEQLLNGQSPRLTRLEDAPPVAIVPPVRPDPTVPETELTLALGASDLEDVRLYHNDRPIPTGLGRSKKLPAQFRVRARLLPGANRFYAMASRQGAFDSRSGEVVIPYEGPIEPGRVHVVALGVGNYQRRRLKYAQRDADRLSEVLYRRGVDSAGGQGMRIYLPDSQVTQERVEQAFDQIAERVEERPQDTVVVFLAGHTGVFDQQRFCLLLSRFPFRAEEPEQVTAREAVPRQTAKTPIDPDQVLPYSVVAVNLMRLKALNRLVIVDACQAEAIRDDPQVSEIQKWMEIGSRRAKTSYLMAARRGEPAVEVDPLGHGLFTYTLLRGMGAIDPKNDPDEISSLSLPTNADTNGDGILSTTELDVFVKENLPVIARMFPSMVVAREARLAKNRPTSPISKLEQLSRLQTADVSFPLIPLRDP